MPREHRHGSPMRTVGCSAENRSMCITLPVSTLEEGWHLHVHVQGLGALLFETAPPGGRTKIICLASSSYGHFFGSRLSVGWPSWRTRFLDRVQGTRVLEYL